MHKLILHTVVSVFFCAVMLLPAPGYATDLLELYQEAMAGSPALKMRQHVIERARADAGVSVSRLYPQVSLQASASRNDYQDVAGSLSYNGQRITLSARQALIDLPSKYRYDSALHSSRQAESEAELARVQLTAQLADTYLEALEASDEMDQVLVEKEAAANQVARLLAMTKRQMAKVTDLTEAVAYLQQLETRQIDVANKSAAAKVKLRELCGRDPGTLATLVRTKFPDVPHDEDFWVRAALDSNPDLSARSAALLASRSGAESARAEHIPQLSLLLQRNQSNQDIDNSPRRDFSVNVIALELRIPIYEGGRVNASTSSALAQLSVAEQQLEASRRSVERDMRMTYASGNANRARIDSTDNQVFAMEQSVAAQERGYELGVVTVISVLDTRRRLLRARVEQSKARYDFLRDLIVLRMRAGKLQRADVEEFNQWLAMR